MSSHTELIKLQTMFYHMREDKHVRFLQNNELYMWFVSINTFKGGPKPEVRASTDA